jgi:aldehyde:ferredoxin oxidoreductase
MYGYTGRCLRVNLSEEKHSIEDLPPKLLTQFMGGRGLGVKVYSDEVDPKTDPLGPENKVIFVSGPLVGTGAVTGASCNVVTKSALSGTIACAKMRGHFGAELKFAGFDMIIIEGRAESPVILSILDDKISIQPGLQFSIGPAGEKSVPLANIVNDGFLSVGGAGIGAVMGSKNLKAIAIRGSHSLSVADSDRFVRVVTNLINKLNSAPLTSHSMSAWGSAFFVDLCYQKGILPQNNFQGAAFTELKDIGTEALSNAFALRSSGCFACPIACLKKTDVNYPLFKGRGMAPTRM